MNKNWASERKSKQILGDASRVHMQTCAQISQQKKCLLMIDLLYFERSLNCSSVLFLHGKNQN